MIFSKGRPLSEDVQIEPDPVDDRAEEYEEMPQEMGSFSFQGEGNDTQGIHHAPQKDAEQQRYVFPEKAGQKDEPAPSQDDEQGHVKPFGTAGAEHAHQGDPREDHCPLDAAEDDACLTAPPDQPEGSECAADEQIDGDIVETPPEALDPGAPAEGMIEAAHQKHDDEAGAVNRGGENLGTAPGFQQHQHGARDTEEGADAVGH